ncbi:hypothetical protein ACJMK2_010844 [Sinanodonta woodiana]|uniref:Proline-rich transmembrane protein 3/4 domain-containing protein n=1 Tax=Sinanodonta woodiana TaxID=1069815 RepID=A0ABD3VJR5_SINWO
MSEIYGGAEETGHFQPEKIRDSQTEQYSGSLPRPGELWWSEPEPEWTKAYEEWGDVWSFHVYVFAALFMVLALYTLINLVLICKGSKRHSKRNVLSISLHLMMLFFTSFRAFVMFVDPYTTRNILPPLLFICFWSTPRPGLTASFSILLLVLLDTTRMTIGPPKFQNLRSILIVTAFHFLLVVTSDVLFIFSRSFKPMILFCHMLYILYGTLLFIGYVYTGFKIRLNSSASADQDPQINDISKFIRVSAMSAITALAIVVTCVYTACTEIGLYSTYDHVDAWSFWTLNTVIRIEEITSCCIVLYVPQKLSIRLIFVRVFELVRCKRISRRVFPNSSARLSSGRQSDRCDGKCGRHRVSETSSKINVRTAVIDAKIGDSVEDASDIF